MAHGDECHALLSRLFGRGVLPAANGYAARESNRKASPQKLAAFIASHPEVKPFFAWAKQYTPSSSWASDRFNSLNAFRLVDQSGQSHLVRWSMVPTIAEQPVSEASQHDADFLQKDILQRLDRGPLRWGLVITLAQAGDKSSDAAAAWPADRQTINAGTLVINRATPQQQGPCNDINFDPLILPDGIVLPPLLPVTNSGYALLRPLHSWVALALFATVMLHLAAALLHAFILRDGVFRTMTGMRRRD